jgi:Flp pilus assembly protein TadD
MAISKTIRAMSAASDVDERHGPSGLFAAILMLLALFRTIALGADPSTTSSPAAESSPVASSAPTPVQVAGEIEKLRYEAVLRRLETDALVSSGTTAITGTSASQGSPDAKPGGNTAQGLTQFKLQCLKLATAQARRDDFRSAMKVLASARKELGAADPFVDELEGTLLVMKKDYAGGEVSFRKEVEKAPASVAGRFNLAETIFLQGRYLEAETSFAYLDALERDRDPALADLCRFKRVMCLLAAGVPELAAKLIPGKDDPSAGSPAMRYCAAAICYAKKDYASADLIIREIRQEIGVNVENLFADSFIELQWGSRDENGVFHVKSGNAKG